MRRHGRFPDGPLLKWGDLVLSEGNEASRRRPLASRPRSPCCFREGAEEGAEEGAGAVGGPCCVAGSGEDARAAALRFFVLHNPPDKAAFIT